MENIEKKGRDQFSNLRVRRADYLTIANQAYRTDESFSSIVDRMVTEWISQNIEPEHRVVDIREVS